MPDSRDGIESEDQGSNRDRPSPKRQLSPLEVEIKDLRRGAGLMRDQIDILQVESKGREKPWYRNASVVVSTLAALTATGFTILNLYQQGVSISQQDIKAKQATLRASLTKLVEVRREFIQLVQGVSTSERDQIDSLINSQRQFLLEEATGIVDELKGDAGTNSLIFLGYEMQQDSNFVSALDYFKRALASIEENGRVEKNIRVVALRSLGGIYMIPNTGLTDIQKGRENWRKAADAQKTTSDEYGLFQLGTTYVNWHFSEEVNGNTEEARALLSKAGEAFASMSPQNPQREQALFSLEHTKKALDHPTSPTSVTGVIGAWSFSYPNDGRFQGNATITPDEDNQSFFVLGELFEGSTGRLVRKWNGRGIFVERNAIRIEWQGTMVGEYGPQPINGSTLLRFDESGVAEGSESILGLVPTSVRFARYVDPIPE